MDIDGILCKDPIWGTDLDETKYINHILNAPPLMQLKQTAMALCTHRIIKYSKETTQWLKKNNIEYNKLYMLGFGSMQEKIKNMNSKSYLNMKSTVYYNHPEAKLFIESDWIEAQRIYNNLHRPVLCLDKNILLQD